MHNVNLIIIMILLFTYKQDQPRLSYMDSAFTVRIGEMFKECGHWSGRTCGTIYSL